MKTKKTMRTMKTHRTLLNTIRLTLTVGSTLLCLGAPADQFTNVTASAGLTNENG